MRKVGYFLVIAGIILAAGCFENTKQNEQTETDGGKNQPTSGDPLIDKGLEITAAVQQVLAAKLQQTIQDSGVTTALRYCSLSALPLTDSLTAVHGVASISRISSKNRNPQNKATQEEALLGLKWSQQKEAGETPEPVILEDSLGKVYYGPIFIASNLCLKCHGVANSEIAMADFIIINNLYPNDLATGYKLGDVRGLWKVRFKRESI